MQWLLKYIQLEAHSVTAKLDCLFRIPNSLKKYRPSSLYLLWQILADSQSTCKIIVKGANPI